MCGFGGSVLLSDLGKSVKEGENKQILLLIAIFSFVIRESASLLYELESGESAEILAREGP